MLCWMVWTGFIGDGVWCVVGLCGLWVAGLIHSDGVMCCVCVLGLVVWVMAGGCSCFPGMHVCVSMYAVGGVAR